MSFKVLWVITCLWKHIKNPRQLWVVFGYFWKMYIFLGVSRNLIILCRSFRLTLVALYIFRVSLEVIAILNLCWSYWVRKEVWKVFIGQAMYMWMEIRKGYTKYIHWFTSSGLLLMSLGLSESYRLYLLQHFANRLIVMWVVGKKRSHDLRLELLPF